MATPQGLLALHDRGGRRRRDADGARGPALVLETMRALGVSEVLDGALGIRRRNSGATDAQKVEALVLLMAAGGDCVDDIEVLRADKGLLRLVGPLPSADVLLTFLYAFHDERLIEQAQRERPASQVAYIPKESAPLMGLSRAVGLVDPRGRGAARKVTRATLDHDATIQESHKKQALAHYKGGRGYQPSAIHWAELDVVLADEYRDGNVPAAMSNLPLIQRGFAALPPTVTERSTSAPTAPATRTRSSSGSRTRSARTARRATIGFTISADMTEPLRRVCEAVPEQAWTLCDDRPTETVMCADVEFTPGDWPKEAQPLRYVALRIRKKQGQLFGGGYDTKYLAVVSNRRELSAARARPVALGEGGHDRARARRDQERARRGRSALRTLRRERGVVPAESLDLQRPVGDEVAGAPALDGDGASQEDALRRSSRSPGASSRTPASSCCASGARPRRSPRSSPRASGSHASARPASPPRPRNPARSYLPRGSPRRAARTCAPRSLLSLSSPLSLAHSLRASHDASPRERGAGG